MKERIEAVDTRVITDAIASSWSDSRKDVQEEAEVERAALHVRKWNFGSERCEQRTGRRAGGGIGG